MKNNHKYSVVAGIVMFVLAALFSVCLLMVAVDFGGMNPANSSIFYAAGKLITKVYGISSAFIPLFLITAGIQCFTSRWSIRNGVVLAGSIIPFFTIDAIEHIIRIIADSNSGSVMWVKIGSTLLTGGMIVAVEYFLLSILGDVIARYSKKSEPDSQEEKVFGDEEAVVVHLETEEADENQDEEISEDNEPAEEKIEEEKAQPQEDVFDLRNDRLFNEQKKLLKDLIEVGLSKDKVEKLEKEISELETKVEKNTTAINETKEVLSETMEKPEETSENDDEEKPEEEIPSPFDLPEPKPAVFESRDETEEESAVENEETEIQGSESLQNDASEEESEATEVYSDDDQTFVPDVASEYEPVDFDEPVLVDEYKMGGVAEEEPEVPFDETVSDEEPFAPEDESFVPKNEIPAADETEVQEDFLSPDFEREEEFAEEPVLDEAFDEESVPVGSEDFVSESDDDFNPAEFEPAPESAIVDPSEFFDEPESEAVFEENAMSAAADSQEEEIEPEEEDIAIEDIFSQMEDVESEVNGNAGTEPADEEKNLEDPLFNLQNQTEEVNIDVFERNLPEEESIEIYNIDDIPDELPEEPFLDSGNSQDEEGDSYSEEASAEIGFDADSDEEDRSLSGIEGIDDDIDLSEESDGSEFDLAGEASNEADEFVIPEIDEEETEMETALLSDSEEISEEDRKAGITKEDDPYERKQKRRIASYKISPELLNTYENGEYWVIDDETRAAGENLKQTLNEFGIEAEVTGIRKGPVVTMFEILPAPGVKLGRIVTLQDNIALSLAASSVRIIAPIPGKHAVGIEVPNKKRAVVSFREIVSEKLAQFEKMQIPVILGKDISGEPQLIDLAKTPHLLIAGSTGAGKSVCVNSMILSILYKRSPQQVKLVLIDPKVVELKLYNDIPHLLTPVITEPKRALQALQYCLCEMERRYALLDGMSVRDIISYNRRIEERRIATEKLPYIVVVIDEFADLMATTGKELETTIARLAAMSRAVGIHLVLATQRPSVNVITGLIKANIPSRIAFMVASRQDSQIIIDGIGAEKLLGKGDMLYASATDPFPTRIQGTLVSDDEVERVVNEVKEYGEPEYIDEEIFVDEDEEVSTGPGLFSDGEDPLYDQALQIVIQAGKASASYIQRRLKIGYNRAARLVEEMEERGIVGPQNGSKPREVIHMP